MVPKLSVQFLHYLKIFSQLLLKDNRGGLFSCWSRLTDPRLSRWISSCMNVKIWGNWHHQGMELEQMPLSSRTKSGNNFTTPTFSKHPECLLLNRHRSVAGSLNYLWQYIKINCYGISIKIIFFNSLLPHPCFRSLHYKMVWEIKLAEQQNFLKISIFSLMDTSFP